MSNIQLIKKENFFSKIKNFIISIFNSNTNKKNIEYTINKRNITTINNSKKEVIDNKETKENKEINEDKEIKEYNEMNEDKENFLKLYEKVKKEEVDLYSLSENTLEKICKLMEEEIKIKKRAIEVKEQKIADIKKELLKFIDKSPKK